MSKVIFKKVFVSLNSFLKTFIVQLKILQFFSRFLKIKERRYKNIYVMLNQLIQS